MGGLSIHKTTEGGRMVKPGRRLFLTAERDRLVPDGDPAAAVLFCSQFAKVPEAEYKALLEASGDIAEPEAKDPDEVPDVGQKAKEADPPADKSKKAPADKGKGSKKKEG